MIDAAHDGGFRQSVSEAILVQPVTWNDLEYDYHDAISLDNLTMDNHLNSSLWSNWSLAENANIRNHYSTWQIAVLATLAGVTSLVTIAGNLIVILSFIVERTIRQPTNYFIASLAVSDLFIGSVSMPFYTVYLLAGQRWPLGEILCDLWLSVDYTVCLCSIYTVFCITIDRYCSVKIPARYRDWRTENKVLAMVTVTWAIPVLVFFTSIFGWQYFVGQRTVPTGKCYVQYMEAALFNCLLQVGYFWITLTIMCALYTGIYQVVLHLSRKSEEKQKKLTTMVSLVGSALRMRATVDESDGQNRLRIPNRNDDDDDDDSAASVDQEVTQKDRNKKRRSLNTGSDSNPSQSHGRSPNRTRRKATEAKRKANDICRSDNGERRHHARGRTERTLLFGQKKNGGPKSSRETSRKAIVVSEANEEIHPGDVCPSLQNSGTSGDSIDRLSSQNVAQYKTNDDQDGQSNHGTCSSTCIANYKTPNALTLQVPRQPTNPQHNEEVTRQPSSPATTLNLLMVRPTVSRKSSSVSTSSRRSGTAIGPTNLKWTSKAQLKPRNPNLSENRARKALRTITVILGAFVLCWTPWHVLSMVISFCPVDQVCVEPLLYDISYWLCYLNSPINPLCYALANQQFKKTFIRIIKMDFHRT